MSFFLDLEKELDTKYDKKFDIVFNHTTLEHIFNSFIAFKNLCQLSKDLVIIIVPFLQEEHGNYGDYWRFTPQTIKKLFEINNFNLIYLNYNDSSSESIYIFAIGSRNTNYQKIIDIKGNKINNIGSLLIGKNIIKNNFMKKLFFYINNFFKND